MTFPGWSARACWSALIAVTLSFQGERVARAEQHQPSASQAEVAERRRAEELYKEGALLLANGKYLEAEERFQESYKLLNGRGTLLNLAICHENLGRLASAWREFKSLEEQASVAGDTARLEAAREHLAWLEPQLSYLSVSLSGEARLSGLQVEIDGKPVPGFDVLFPVDAGRHQLRAGAPGKKDWILELSVQNGNQRQNLTIPRLEELAALPSRAPLPTQASGAAVQQPPKGVPQANYTSVYIAGAATLTLTAGAVVSSFLYYDRKASYDEFITPPDNEKFDEEEQGKRHASAKRMGWINGSLIVAASAGAVLTGILWYRASRTKKAQTAEGVWVAPLLVGPGAGLQAGARF